MSRSKAVREIQRKRYARYLVALASNENVRAFVPFSVRAKPVDDEMRRLLRFLTHSSGARR